MRAPTCEEYQDFMVEPMQESAQHGDYPLPALNMDSSSLKRTVGYDEEGIELLLPGKRPRLEDKSRESNKGAHPEAITKIADSPVPVKDEPMAVQEAYMDSKAESSEPMKLEGLKLEQECTEKEKGELELAKLSQSLKDKYSQSNTELNIGDQAELLDNKQEDPKLQIVFSDEEDEGGANGSHVTTSGRMLSSQMNRQIDRVQVFLKLERLRRPKK